MALHPSGIFVAIGFNDQLRLMEILLDDLKVTKTFNFPKCKDCQFSHQGHMLACAYDQLVTIVEVFSFQTVRTFKVGTLCFFFVDFIDKVYHSISFRVTMASC